MKKIPIEITHSELAGKKMLDIIEPIQSIRYFESLVKIPESILKKKFKTNLIDHIEITCPVTGATAKAEHHHDDDDLRASFGAITTDLAFTITEGSIEIDLGQDLFIAALVQPNKLCFYLDYDREINPSFSAMVNFTFKQYWIINTMEDLRIYLVNILMEYYQACRNVCTDIFHNNIIKSKAKPYLQSKWVTSINDSDLPF